MQLTDLGLDFRAFNSDGEQLTAAQATRDAVSYQIIQGATGLVVAQFGPGPHPNTSHPDVQNQTK